MSESKKSNRAIYKYIRKNNIVPEIHSLEEINTDDLQILTIAENKWINKLLSDNTPLLNTQTRSEKTTIINVYQDTLNEIKQIVKTIPGMTISRFYDEAVNNKLKTIYEQNARSVTRGTDNSETPTV